MDVPWEAQGSAEWWLAALVTGPCGTLDSAPQAAPAAGRSGVGVAVGDWPKHLEASPYTRAGGGAAGRDGVPTPPFPKQVTPSWTPPPRLLFSRKTDVIAELAG